jgi:hypothetical protein
MLPLYEMATRFLVRGAYRIEDAMPGFAIAEYAGEDLRDKPQRILMWVGDEALKASRALDAEARQSRSQREDDLLREMIAEMQASQDAVGYYVVPSRQGLSAEFITSATDALQRGGRDKRGGVRTAAEFFDTDYKTDTRSGRAAKASALGRLFDRVRSRQRVAQPFLFRTGLGFNNRKMAEGDLVEHLDLVFRDPVNRATLRIIDGPAGSGKSVAFETLVAALYDEFMEGKKRQVARPRPIAFLPEHIRGEALAGYVDNVIDAAMEAEAARPVEADQLRFLLTHGYSMWLFDGLDEFFGNDNNFFDYLGRELANPESRAQVLICSRDSLLTSSTALRTFVEAQLAKGHAIEMYELAPWGPEAWRHVAWMELEAGISGRETSPRVAGFVEALSASPELSQLATLPFYCIVLLDEFRKTSALPADPLAVLDTIIERMLTREGDKNVFAWRDFVDLDVMDEAAAMPGDGMAEMEKVLDQAGRDNLREMLGFVAHKRVRHSDAKGDAKEIDVDDLRDAVGPAYVDSSLAADENDRVLTTVVQFAFFGAGKRAGAVDFSHPILAEHLAAGYALTLLRGAAERLASMAGATGMAQASLVKGAVRQALGPAKLDEETVFFRALARGIMREPQIAAVVAQARGLVGKDERKLARALETLGKVTGL